MSKVVQIVAMIEFGHQRYYPKNEAARDFAYIAGSDCLLRDQLDAIKRLGHEIEVVSMTIEELDAFQEERKALKEKIKEAGKVTRRKRLMAPKKASKKRETQPDESQEVPGGDAPVEHSKEVRTEEGVMEPSL